MKNTTKIVALLDASGSMFSILDDSIGGFNSFIEDQKQQAPKDSLSVIFFNSNHWEAFNTTLDKAPVMDKTIYKPAGSTALYDAVGSTIDKVGLELSNIPEQERPSKVIILILTDGQENCSKEYNSSKVKEMINHQRSKYSWEFVFLAATEEGLKDGEAMGIAKSISFEANSRGTKSAYDTLSAATTSFRAN